MGLFGNGKKKLAAQQAEVERQRLQLEQLRMQHEQHEQLEQLQRWKQMQLEEQLRRQNEQWIESQLEQKRREDEQQEKMRQEQEIWENEEKIKRERRQRRLEKLKLTSPQALRGLRDLIRTRYQLDMYIWSLKGARGPDRPIVEEKMAKADAVLMEIYTMVETWEENDRMWTPEEWRLAQIIKERILSDGKRWWENNHPWNEA